MSRKFQLRALAGLIFTLAVVVGVLVLPEPKEARADTTYTVYIWRAGQGGVTDATVLIALGEEDPIEANNAGGGLYTLNAENAPLTWKIFLDPWANPDYIGLEPWWGFESDELWGSETYEEWEVEPAR